MSRTRVVSLALGTWIALQLSSSPAAVERVGGAAPRVKAVAFDALTYSAHAMNLELTPDYERRLLDAYLHLTPWPDTVGTLQTLKRSAGMLPAQSRPSNLLGESRQSADRAVGRCSGRGVAQPRRPSRIRTDSGNRTINPLAQLTDQFRLGLSGFVRNICEADRHYESEAVSWHW